MKIEIKGKIVSQIELIPTYTKDNLPKELLSIEAVKPEAEIFNEKD